MKTCKHIALAMLASCVTTAAIAHEINPLEDKYQQHGASVLQRITEPVHEEITHLARACAANAVPGAAGPLSCEGTAVPAPATGHKYDSLIRGVWWNDDPNQLLFAGTHAHWLAWLKDADHIAKKQRNLKGREAKITPGYYLHYRSHYGDLQFLHAMAAAPKDDPAMTRGHLIDWARFAYGVATGEIDPELTMERLDTPIARSHFKQQPGWTVNYLFAHRYRLTQPNYARDMALGSLLHLVQDSYSEAHTRRSFEPSDRCPAGRVLEFHSYTPQNPDKHGGADSRAAWSARPFTAAQNPVNASATLIHFARSGADWGTVEQYLTGTVFCLDSDAQPASGGPFV